MPLKPLFIKEEAIAEAQEAWTRYREASPRTSDRFQLAFDDSIQKIHVEPERWPEYVLGTRYVQLTGFPYLVVYRETDKEIQVIALAHGHRREGYWKLRLRN